MELREKGCRQIISVKHACKSLFWQCAHSTLRTVTTRIQQFEWGISEVKHWANTGSGQCPIRFINLAANHLIQPAKPSNSNTIGVVEAPSDSKPLIPSKHRSRLDLQSGKRTVKKTRDIWVGSCKNCKHHRYWKLNMGKQKQSIHVFRGFGNAADL